MDIFRKLLWFEFLANGIPIKYFLFISGQLIQLPSQNFATICWEIITRRKTSEQGGGGREGRGGGEGEGGG